MHQTNCSRETDSSAPFSADLGSDWHRTAPEEGKAIENGNPDIRIPIDLPGKEGDALGREEEDEVVGAGNPDIRVPRV
ncbi:hypothetical protein NDU88_005382 [Pleurodeles waltl]|uniref:Uncharacterized protein n=1 Tax=Pleurodeles waltl TaxID=8319 RepID=A0AAV7TAU9_PLEWA|nr:hypothetical protein NDU88_005382 [Pleurodeles waltl]